MLADPIHVGVYNTHVSSQGVITREGLFFRAQVAPYLELARIVDRVLMTCQVVRPREDRVARLAGRWIDAVTAMGTGLRVP